MGGARSREETRDEGGVWIAHMHGSDIFCSLIQHILFFPQRNDDKNNHNNEEPREGGKQHTRDLPLLEEQKNWGVRKRQRPVRRHDQQKQQQEGKKEDIMKKKHI